MGRRGRASIATGLAAIAVLVWGQSFARAAPLTQVRVVVPEYSLQYSSFWVAQGAGYFREEGLDVQLTVAPQPPATAPALVNGSADLAVLPAPMFLDLIGQKSPVVAFANLLRNDPIGLVVRRPVADARGLSPTAPMAQRLQAMKGLRVGVASGPPTRLRALFATVGLNADRDITMVTVPGPQQNPAFASGQVDALYSHTPYLENALVDQGGVLLVDQPGGEVPELAGRQIHSMVTTRAFAGAHPAAVLSATRAIYRAQQLVHADLGRTADALLASGVRAVDHVHVERFLQIYQRAIPDGPEVSVDGIAQSLRLFPASSTPPDLSGVNLADYVAPNFALQAVHGPATSGGTAGRAGASGPARPLLAAGAIGALLLLSGAVAFVAWRRRSRS